MGRAVTEERACAVEPRVVQVGQAETSVAEGGERHARDHLIPVEADLQEALKGTGSSKVLDQSPIMVLYDTILSHPALTCIAFPCIPCLAVYVKATERNAPDVAPRRRIRKKGKMKIEDDSTFAEYNAVRVSKYMHEQDSLHSKIFSMAFLTSNLLVVGCLLRGELTTSQGTKVEVI